MRSLVLVVACVGACHGDADTNLPPENAALMHSPEAPQPIGLTINWTASATDPEGDAPSYRFFLTGPSTNDEPALQQDWSSVATWPWATAGVAAGVYTVTVWVRDGLHAPITAFDASAEARFEVTAPLCNPTGSVGAMLGILSAADVTARRAALIQYIWSGAGFPANRMPDDVQQNVVDSQYNGVANLAGIDRLTIDMARGVNSIVYHFRPVVGNGRLAIYHQGHDGDFVLGLETIRFLVGRGYAVLGFAMPLVGNNSQPTTTLPGGSMLTLSTHDDLPPLEAPEFSPISYFLDPVAAGINWAIQNFNYTTVYAIGISGGAWTITLYAAIDPRLARTYPVAGSLPVYLRIPEDLGDYEQIQADLYMRANYMELYLLGAAGTNRRQLQILNRFDACCFASNGIEPEIQEYRDAVGERLGCLSEGGSFDVFFDASHMSHIVSPLALQIIGNDLPQ